MRRFASVASGLFAALAACGDDGGARHLADAPPGGDDAPLPDAPRVTTVNITAYARYFEGLPAMTPREGARVFALDATFTVVATATTGADGKASVELPNGGSVTIAYPDMQQTSAYFRSWVTTYFGVKPGDSLVVGDSFSEGPSSQTNAGTEVVRWPTLANADTYRLYTPCDRYGYYTPPTTSATISLYNTCAGAGPIILVGYETGNVTGSILVASATHADTQDHDLAAPGWTTQAATPNFISVLTGLPADGQVLQLGARGDYGPWSVDQVMTGLSIDENGMASAMVSVPSTAPRLTAVADVRRGKLVGRQRFAKTGVSPVSIDASTLPMFDGSPIVDANARKVTWPMPVGTYDHTILQFQWSYVGANDVTHRMTWNAVLPPGVAELDASSLPADLVDLIPSTTNFDLVNVRVVDLANAASYDAARQLPEWQLSYPIESVHNGAMMGAAFADGGEGSNIWEPYSVPY